MVVAMLSSTTCAHWKGDLRETSERLSLSQTSSQLKQKWVMFSIARYCWETTEETNTQSSIDDMISRFLSNDHHLQPLPVLEEQTFKFRVCSQF